MMADLKPYPAMKDSGVEWLGAVPEHWRLERGKWLFTKKERAVRDTDEVVTCFRDGVVTLRKNRRIRGFTESLKEIGYQGIKAGDLVIHAMDAFAGAVGVADSDGKGTPVYAVCQSRSNANAHYHAFVVREMARSQWILALATGIRERSTDFRFATFANQPLPLPPLIEQTAIVRFLDYIDRRVLRYIRAKQKLIKLLEEQKQAIIHCAVTRGLDPDVPLKPSGVQWLGEVPEHWEVARLRNVTQAVTSGSRGWSSYAADEGPLFIRVANLNRMSLDVRFHDVVRLKLSDTTEATRTQVHTGDILLSITAYIGSVAVVPVGFEEAYVSQHVARCALKDNHHNPRWLGYVLLSDVGQTHGKLSLYGGTKDGLSLDDVKNYPILLPPRSEQDQLVLHIEKSVGYVDAAIDRARREIELLREYRTRLIADVVTGKLDVRAAAAQLPDEADESEPLDDMDAIGNGGEERADDLDTAQEEIEA